MTFRVVQWATGGVGRAAIEGVLRHPELELVGCWVHSADKAGRDVGELIGAEPIGVRASGDAEQVRALEADCVVYAPLLPNEDEVAALLLSGKNVVTPVGWIYPDDAQAERLNAACRAGGTTLHGTGIHPGGMTELIPLVLSSLTSAVTYVRAEEFSDVRTYGAPDVLRHLMGFGGTREQALGGPIAKILSGGFGRSVRMVVDALGFAAAAEVRCTQQVAVATAPIDSPIGVIEPGLVAARRFVWDALVGGRVVVSAVVNWLMGEQQLEPDWTFGPAGERFEVEVRGDPDVRASFTGLQPQSVAAGLVRNPGIVTTAMHCVNSIPYVCRAEPGVRSYLDLPVVVGRAAPSLSRRRGARALP